MAIANGLNPTVDSIAAKYPVQSGSGATVTLTEAQSGSLILFDKVDGIVYTLPAPKAGIWYEFITSQTITSNAAKILGNLTNGTSVMVGVAFISDGSDVTTSYKANGTTHIAISSNGTTTGGIKGSRIRVTGLSAGTWHVRADLVGSGSIATPFATS